MAGFYSKYIKLIHLTGDIALIILSTIAAFKFIDEPLRLPFHYFISLSLAFWFICASLLSTYKTYHIRNINSVILDIFKLIFLYILLIEAFFNITNIEVVRNFLLTHYSLLLVSIGIWRTLVISSLKVYRKKGYNYRKVIIAGYGEAGLELFRFITKHPEHGYRFLGFFDDRKLALSEVIGNIGDIESFVLENNIDEIYCCPLELEKNQISGLQKFVDRNLVRIKFLPEPGELPFGKLKVDLYDVMPVLILRPIPLDDVTNKALKRGFDLLFSSFIILFILSWLLPILAIIIKLDSKGPIFFKQARSGIDNKSFNCFKLRSMYVNADANCQQARRGDSRITPVGAFLRKTSLDELPQFFNVFMGHMSVVGPRPHMLKHTEEYSGIVDKFMVRHFVKPGITGLSQVRGYRGDTSEAYQMRGRVRLDIFYLENWTLFLDLKIIYYTIHNAIKGDQNAF